VDRASARNIEDLLLTKEESFPYLGSLTPDIDAEKLRSATIIAMMNQKPLRLTNSAQDASDPGIANRFQSKMKRRKKDSAER
jgi:hypothetical protein